MSHERHTRRKRASSPSVTCARPISLVVLVPLRWLLPDTGHTSRCTGGAGSRLPQSNTREMIQPLQVLAFNLPRTSELSNLSGELLEDQVATRARPVSSQLRSPSSPLTALGALTAFLFFLAQGRSPPATSVPWLWR